MKVKELREKTDAELKLEREKLINKHRELRFKKVVGVIDNPLQLRTIKKDIARINTILHQRKLEKLYKELNIK
ncbi:MAG TPA: 50S ribosomal protein L29 [Spirochaetota bacterium]|nr:50S ribosomal protein L29 [Spirochaetota bacterium]HPP03274.1 50S ribosomal protein L29 [Spirochaetota bacterium]